MRNRNISIAKSIFLFGMIINLFIFGLSIPLSRGVTLANNLFGGLDSQDTFMDHFNNFSETFGSYVPGQQYPPLACIISVIFGHLVPQDLLASYDFGSNRFCLRESQLGIMEFFLFLIILIYLFGLFFKATVKSKKWVKEASFLCIILSAPFLFAFERGNVLLVSLVGTMAFLWGYDSPKKSHQLIAFFALSVAAAIKIYPAVLGLLLVQERRWKDTLLLAVLGLATFLLPFLAFDGGFANLPVFLSNLVGFSEGLSHSTSLYRHDISSILYLMQRLITGDILYFSSLFSTIVLLSIVSLILLCPNMVKWKAAAALTSLIAIIPAPGYTYNLVFLACPLALFLSEDNCTDSIWDCLYAVCLLLVFMPLVLTYNPNIATIYQSYIGTIVKDFGLYGFIFLLYLETILNILKGKHLKAVDKES